MICYDFDDNADGGGDDSHHQSQNWKGVVLGGGMELVASWHNI